MKVVDPAVTDGEIAAMGVADNVRSVMAPAGRAWASSPSKAPLPGEGMALYPRILTVNTAAGLPADKQCGRAVHLDAGITLIEGPNGRTGKFPENCGTTLTKGEEALAFLFFDL